MNSSESSNNSVLFGCRFRTEFRPLPTVLRGERDGVRGVESLAKSWIFSGFEVPLTPDPSPPEYRGRGEKYFGFETAW